MADSPSVTDLGDDAPIRALQAEWNSLARRLPATSYFVSGDWARSWWNAHDQPISGELATWRSADGGLAAVVALHHQRERLHPSIPIRTKFLAPIGSGLGGADHSGFLVDPTVAPDVREWISSRSRRESLLARNVSSERAMHDLVPGSMIVGHAGCPVAPLPLPVTASFAKKLQQYARRLEREGVWFETLAPGLVGPEAIDAFETLQRQRRTAQGVDTSVSDFHIRLLREIAGYGGPGWGLTATVARLDDRPVGVLLGFQTPDRFEFYQIGWNPELASLSIGSVLIDTTARWAADQGANLFDFLRGDDEYKRRFGAEPVFDQHVIRPAGIGGRLLLVREQRRASRSTIAR
jgi:CelD/BcsL family acetyltransferase involved in cellulose biosynthesis